MPWELKIVVLKNLHQDELSRTECFKYRQLRTTVLPETSQLPSLRHEEAYELSYAAAVQTGRNAPCPVPHQIVRKHLVVAVRLTLLQMALSADLLPLNLWAAARIHASRLRTA